MDEDGQHLRTAGIGSQKCCHHVIVLELHLRDDDRGDIDTRGCQGRTKNHAGTNSIGR
jgi:hypothetical protein